jgi:phosphoenolpyruvate-protein phosphotransferase (PTS system enzyme I)
MGLVLSGISVSRGIAIGLAYLLQHDDLEISEYSIPTHLIEDEITRFKTAIEKAKQQLKEVRNRIPVNTPTEITAFIDAHLLMLEDAALSEAPVNIIKTRHCNAEWAMKLQREALISVFDAMDDPYLRTRKDDVDHVVKRIQTFLIKQGDPQHVGVPDGWLKDSIVVADDLSPADMMMMQHQGVAAFVTEYGGPNSHTAILARSLGIPAVVGIHHIRSYLQQNEILVLDGQRGIVLADPEPQELEYFRQRRRAEKLRIAGLKKLKEQPAITSDGHKVTLLANVELLEDIPLIKRVAAAGIGLFRTEMLFMNRDEMPGEEEQFRAYLKIVRAMKGAPVTIRTLDLGADKQLDGRRQAGTMATNPALGLRSIRWCLKDPTLFVPQIRAILRASGHGPVRMMIPMLSTIQELLQVLRMVDEEKRSLRARGIMFNRKMPIGGMVEIPAAALAADAFARHLDFLSIGTNDLIQYTLAVDRLDEEVNYLYNPLHPAILQLISMTMNAGKKAGIPVAMCGEMAGDVRYTRLLLGLGLREFSMLPATLLEVKRIVKTSDAGSLARQVRKVLKMSHPVEIAEFVEKINIVD